MWRIGPRRQQRQQHEDGVDDDNLAKQLLQRPPAQQLGEHRRGDGDDDSNGRVQQRQQRRISAGQKQRIGAAFDKGDAADEDRVEQRRQEGGPRGVAREPQHPGDEDSDEAVHNISGMAQSIGERKGMGGELRCSAAKGAEAKGAVSLVLRELDRLHAQETTRRRREAINHDPVTAWTRS